MSLPRLRPENPTGRGGGQHRIRPGDTRGCGRCSSPRSGPTSPTTGLAVNSTAATVPRSWSPTGAHGQVLCTTDRTRPRSPPSIPGHGRGPGDQPAIVDLLDRPDLVVISPNDPEAMLRQHPGVPRRGYPVRRWTPRSSCPGWTATRSGPWVDGARYLFANDYRGGAHRTEDRLGRRPDPDRVGIPVTTHGAQGVCGGPRPGRAGQLPDRVPVVPGPGTSPTRPGWGTPSGPGSWPPPPGACRSGTGPRWGVPWRPWW